MSVRDSLRIVNILDVKEYCIYISVKSYFLMSQTIENKIKSYFVKKNCAIITHKGIPIACPTSAGKSEKASSFIVILNLKDS